MSKKQQQENDKWIELLVSCAMEAVEGYESYLLDEVNFKELAILMTRLRNAIEYKTKFIKPQLNENEKSNDDE